MGLLLGIVLIIVFICSPTFRCALKKFPIVVWNAIKDGVDWIVHKKWRLCPTGYLVDYSGLFGKGKTLTGVHDVVDLYNRYNNLKVYDKFRKRWVIQKIDVYSNVELTIPHIPFTSMQQMVDVTKQRKTKDEICGTLTVSLFLGDEFSVQMNSREFKKNFNAHLLNSILTCRHHYISLFYTAQRFMHVDALLRQVTCYVVECDKLWRFVRNNYYDAWEMENATSATLIKPFRRKCWFATDKEFNYYNTLACVDNMVKDCEEGKTLTEQEVLALQGYETVGVEGIVKPSRKLKKARKAGA